MSERNFTGIDIGSDSIKFATARRGRNGTLQLLNAGCASVGDASSLPEGDARIEGLGAVLKTLLTQRRARIRKAHTCATGRKVITRYAHVPPMPAHRLQKVMAFEIDNETPGGGEDIASDFKLLDLPNKDSEFTVLIGMAKDETIDGQRRILSSVGIKARDVTIGCLPVFHGFIHSKKAELDEMQAPCAVVDIGAEKMEMVVLYGRKLYFARSLTPGSNAFTEAIRQELRVPFETAERIKRERGRLGEASPDDNVPVIPLAGEGAANPDDEDTALGSEEDEAMISAISREPQAADGTAGDPIRRVLERTAAGLVNSLKSCLRYAKAQTRLENLEVGRIYITGGGAMLPGLAEYIQSRLGIETELFNPLENVDISAVDLVGREMLEASPYAFSTAIGLAAGQVVDDPVRMSLLPRAEKERQEFMAHGVYAWAASGVFIVTLVAMTIGSWHSTDRLEEYVEEQQNPRVSRAVEMITELDKLRAANTDLSEKVGRLREIALESKTVLSALAALKGNTLGGEGQYEFPRDVVLSSVRTYADTAPPAHKKQKTTENRFGVKRKEVEKQPKVVRVQGSVSEELDTRRSLDIVYALKDYLAGVEGPLGKRVFEEGKVVKAPAAHDTSFEIELKVKEE